MDPDGGNNSTSQVILTTGSPINLAQDFGYVAAPGSIGNLVWNDLNANGVVDAGETGIPGVTVDLYRDLNGNGRIDPGEPKIGTTTTDGNGAYLFSGLPTTGGNYVVDVTDTASVLTGWWHSLGTAGVDNNSQPDPYAVTLTPGAPNNTADFGYYVKPGAMGNWVWLETVGSNYGLQETGEPGIAGRRGHADDRLAGRRYDGRQDHHRRERLLQLRQPAARRELRRRGRR